MTAADHLRRAEELAVRAEEALTLASRVKDGDEWAFRKAEVFALMAHARAAIAWASIVDDPDLPHPGEYVAPVRGVPAEPTPLEDYRPPRMREAPASPAEPAGASDQNP